MSYPVGVLADRFGSQPLLVIGYGLGSLTAALMVLAFWVEVNSVAALAVVFFVAGLYVAVQEALESTVTADMVSSNTLAMSYGALGTVNGTAKFISSTSVGVLWTAISPVVAFTVAALMMLAGTLALTRTRSSQ